MLKTLTFSPSLSSQYLRSPKQNSVSLFPPNPIKFQSFTKSNTLFSKFKAKAKPKDLILENPSITVEKGKYSYDVETLINKLSSLPPRGSIVRCLDSFKNKLSLNDFASVLKEFAQRGDWQRSLRLFSQIWCKPNEHIYTIIIGVLGREGLLEKCQEMFDEMPVHNIPPTVFSYTTLINAYGRNGKFETAIMYTIMNDFCINGREIEFQRVFFNIGNEINEFS